MYVHPEIARAISAQHIQDLRAQVAADRLAAEARQYRRSSHPSWIARLSQLGRRKAAHRLPVGYPAARKA